MCTSSNLSWYCNCTELDICSVPEADVTNDKVYLSWQQVKSTQ
ncbi:hypothetical protein HMPREF1565_3148 [Providencia alcalifaciens RIMD 1656011]|nr:hypothetical protein [Providencia alcalifaciens]EUD03123.1 hypothetical protein HMPREF1565_3148 [Providencia alcalifaciens RIMD 1656011]